MNQLSRRRLLGASAALLPTTLTGGASNTGRAAPAETVADAQNGVKMSDASVRPNTQQPPNSSPQAGLTATIALNGQIFVFAEDGGTDLGDYSDPHGRFVQRCIRARHPGLTAFTVHFRPDRTSSRTEVVFELGAIFGTAAPFNMPEYTVTIARGGTALATVSVPKHFWFSRWRWQSAPRPVTAKVADLIASGMLPHYDGAVAGGSAPLSTPRRYAGPMDLAGITPYMPQTGERDDIGLITESQAEYACTSSNAALASLMAQLEGSGTLMWHYRDEKTNAPLDIYAYPTATSYSPNGASPYIPWAVGTTGIELDTSHEPDLGYVPFLLTGDPYALEEIQFTVTYNVIKQPFAYRGSFNITGAVRAHAWALRTLVNAATATPDAVPAWLKPRAYFKKTLDANRDWMLAKFVNNPKAPFATLDVMSDAEGSRGVSNVAEDCAIAPWMEDFEAAALGWAVLLGHRDWMPILAWKMKCTIARTNGTSGWNRSTPVAYWMAIRASKDLPYLSWADCWALNVKLGVVKESDPAHLSPGNDPTYPSYALGALAIASAVGVPGSKPCYDWLRSEIAAQSSRGRSIRRKWSIAAAA